MNHYRYDSLEELRRATKRQEIAINIAIYVLVALLIFMVAIISGCSLTINVASDKQPWQIIYQGDGRTE